MSTNDPGMSVNESEPDIATMRAWAWKLTKGIGDEPWQGYHPESRIDDAWELVEKFRETHEISMHGASRKRAWKVWIGGSKHFGSAPTAPEAILRAAWAAREVL